MDGTLGDLFHRAPFHPLFVRRALYLAAVESRLLRDPEATRRGKVERFENRTFKFPLLSTKFITDEPAGFGDPLNFAHRTWSDPWHRHRVFTASFDELFQKGLRLAVWLLPQMSDTARFLAMTGDTNYHDDRVLGPAFQRRERAVAAGEALPVQEKGP